tara:strand:+ start:77 stop:1093 length:1017 start_codon:yes stop_codon:yes gene_type:complete
MAIDWKILGAPGEDNALVVTVDTGQSQARLLFDCGEGCLHGLRPSEIQSIEHLCFSHFHMDHVSGFDTFFRHNYNRPDAPVRVWGPPKSIEVMSHRFRSFIWNLHADQTGEWIVHDVCPSHVDSAKFFTSEAFATAHRLPPIPLEDFTIQRSPSFTLEACLLPHHSISSAAYRIVESDRTNISAEALKNSKWTPGPWIQQITSPATGDETVEIDGSRHSVAELRRALFITTPGDSIAYLTDFRVEPGSEAWTELTQWLSGTDTLVCECQYRNDDKALAEKHGHMTAGLVGRLAAEAGVKSLVLQHLSRRYSEEDWAEMLSEAIAEFPNTSFSPSWAIE